MATGKLRMLRSYKRTDLVSEAGDHRVELALHAANCSKIRTVYYSGESGGLGDQPNDPRGNLAETKEYRPTKFSTLEQKDS